MSTQYGISFNGRRIIHPGAYDAVDASRTTTVTGGSLNIPIVVGTADSGETGKVVYYSNAEDLKADLEGGDLVKASDLLFSPAPEGGGGASTIGVLVANQTVRAQVTKGGLLVKAVRSGVNGNRIQVKLDNGTLAGSKRFTVNKWDSEELEVFDNLGAVLRIQYIGSSPYAVLNVTASKFETKVGADAATSVVDVSLDLTDARFATIEDIAKHVNSLSGYAVSFVDYSRNSTLSSAKLDVVNAVDIKTEKPVMAVKGDLELQLSRFSSLVTVEATGTITNFEFTYLAGGSKGTAPNSFAPYFNTIKKHFSDILVVLSSSEAIHAEALMHVQQMEQRQQKQMLFTGGELGETVAKTKQRASVLNSSRAVIAYPGIYHESVDGGKTMLPPYFTAAMIAGRVCGVDASEPITFDYFNLIGLEVDLLAGDPAINDLLSSGVCVLERVQNGAIRLVQGITTYLGPNNPLFREISVRRGADKVGSRMQSSMEDAFVGKKGLRATASAVETKAIDILEEAIREGDITGYRNIIVRFVGSVVYVDYEVAPVEPINYVLITSHFVPDSLIGTSEDN